MHVYIPLLVLYDPSLTLTMVKTKMTIFLFLFFIFSFIDIVNLIHSLRALFPHPLPDKDNCIITTSSTDFSLELVNTLLYLILFVIGSLFNILLHFPFRVCYVPFNVNLCLLKKNNRDHAMPYFTLLQLYIMLTIICFLNPNFMLYLEISSLKQFLSDTCSNIPKVARIVRRGKKYIFFKISEYFCFFLKFKEDVVVEIELLWYTSLLLGLCSDVHPTFK